MAETAAVFTPAPSRYATPRSPERQTTGHQIVHYAKLLGFRLMPWQVQVAMVAGELLADGTPAYREVIISVPRQSGKTTLLLAAMTQRAMGDPWGRGKQVIVYSAQEGKSARYKLLKDFFPALGYSDTGAFSFMQKRLGIGRFVRASGEESVLWHNQSRLELMTGTKDSGHGRTLDMGVQDELFADRDTRRDASMGPAALTKELAQIWKLSTAGDETSSIWSGHIAKGRDVVDRDLREGVCYFEWSAEPDADPDDEAEYYRCMPALGPKELGFTQSIKTIRAEKERIDDVEDFRRAFFNITKGTGSGSVFTRAVWARLMDPHFTQTTLGPRVGLAADSAEDGSMGVIAVATYNGLVPHCTILQHGDGIDWMPAAMARWSATLAQAPIWYHSSAPVAPHALAGGGMGAKIHAASEREYAAACSGLFNAATADVPELTVPDLSLITTAATSVHRKRLGGGLYVWERSTSTVAISAISLAHLALVSTPRPAEPIIIFPSGMYRDGM